MVFYYFNYKKMVNTIHRVISKSQHMIRSPVFLNKTKNIVNWRGRCETPAGKARLGRPRRPKPIMLPDRPRKASAWIGNYVHILNSLKKTRQS
ncbi:hypothetical protein CQ056_16035 [Peribacillus simplex]|nr:hypothetical protein CQ056_16035 [Peribacillus simplex]